MFLFYFVLVIGQGDVSNDELWACTEQMWSDDVSSLSASQLTFDLSSDTE